MKVSEALKARKSTRAFLSKPVPPGLLRAIIDQAKQAPSGGNMQPWHVYVVEGEATPRLMKMVADRLKEYPRGEPAEFEFYSAKPIEPYTSRRLKCGEDLYGLLGIPREAKAERLAHLARNYVLFGAPAGIFFAIDRRMDRNHWGQLGMFIQSVLLLATEYGLDTCPQEAWATMRGPLSAFFDIPDELVIFCGIAVGYADPEAVVNRLRTDRAPLHEFATFIDK